KYFYRRSLSPGALLPAVGVGVLTGIAAFYVARLYLERTPLVSDPAPPRRAAGARASANRVRGG
ncbi:MAG: hypothetical protein ABI205_06020, partial [Gemmatimonadaceae bacterium]